MKQPASVRQEVASASRIVIKLGTRVLTQADGFPARPRIEELASVVAELRHANRDVLIVSSGAVGLGATALGMNDIPLELQDRQACAAVGQMRLMALYQEALAQHALLCGQVLLTQGDFDDRLRYLNLRGTLGSMLRRGVVPVINENDAVATEELAYVEGDQRRVFGDNDRLSALVAAKLDANLLVLLTDVAGVYAGDPHTDPEARLLSEVAYDDPLEQQLGGARNERSRGGMRSKVAAARVATRAGCHAVIASGIAPAALAAVLAGEETGTWFRARPSLAARRRWIAFAAAPRGVIELDQGAIEAIRGRGASVLAAGVRACNGDFRAGDIVELRAEDGGLVGRGIVHCDADSARAWCAGQAPDGVRNHHALIHRDHLALEEV